MKQSARFSINVFLVNRQQTAPSADQSQQGGMKKEVHEWDIGIGRDCKTIII